MLEAEHHLFFRQVNDYFFTICKEQKLTDFSN